METPVPLQNNHRETLTMFDIKKVQAEAEAEIAKEQGEDAKKAIKAKLRSISAARAVVANLEREYEVLLREVAGG